MWITYGQWTNSTLHVSKRLSWMPHLRHELAGWNGTGFSNPSKEVPKLVFVHHLFPDWAYHLNIYDIIMIQFKTQNYKPPEWAPRPPLLAVHVGASLREETAMLQHSWDFPISCPKQPKSFMGWHVILVGIKTWNLHKFGRKDCKTTWMISNCLAWSDDRKGECCVTRLNAFNPCAMPGQNFHENLVGSGRMDGKIEIA